VRGLSLALVASVVLAGGALPARGVVIRVDFAGAFDFLIDDNALGDGSVEFGTRFSGYAIFDTSTAPFATDPSSQYHFDTPPAEFQVAFGNYVLGPPSDGFVVSLHDGTTGVSSDELSIGAGPPVLLSGALSRPYGHSSLGLSLRGDQLSSEALLPGLFDLAVWESSELGFLFEDPETSDLFNGRGPLDELTLTVIPEPGTLALVSLGASLARLAARRRRPS
jgi:hypothetical protein